MLAVMPMMKNLLILVSMTLASTPALASGTHDNSHGEAGFAVGESTDAEPDRVIEVSITWRFEGDDTVVFACNEPEHFEAGMRHDIDLAHSH